MSAAPSARPVTLMPVIDPVGEVNCPDELKASVPEADGRRTSVPPVADAGSVIV